MILQQTTISLDTLPPELLTFILETRHLEGKPLPQAWYMPLRIVQEKTHDADLQDRIDTAFGRLAQTDDVSEVNEAQTKESEQHYEGPKILAILEEAGEQHAD